MNYPQLLQEILSKGKVISPRGCEIMELNHVQLEVQNNLWDFPNERPIRKILDYWMNELAWYMTGSQDTAFICEKAKLWEGIKNPDGTLNSNYGRLVFYNKTTHPTMGAVTLPPFEWAAGSLEADIHSRQAVVTYNSGGYNFPGNKDYICTQHQAFFIREERLHCYIALRSSDAIFGLPYNMPWWSFVAQMMLDRLKTRYPHLTMGEIKVTIYSAHIYAQHYGLVSRMLNKDKPVPYHALVTKTVPLNQSLDWYLTELPNHLKIIELVVA